MRLAGMPALVSLAALAACHGGPAGGGGGAMAPPPDPPPGAIRLAENRYMVPRGVDRHGCPSYSPWAWRRAVPAAIYYRRADGGFTLHRSEADCGDRPTGSETRGAP